MESNTAGSADGNSGLGGGIFMGDKCSGGTCTTVAATLQNVTFSFNYAHLVSPPCQQLLTTHSACCHEMGRYSTNLCKKCSPGSV